MPSVRETARKLLLVPILFAALTVAMLPASAMAAPNQQGQKMSGGTATASPGDSSNRPAGAGTGRKVR